MPCVAIQTGGDFLATALAHVDCQAQSIGAYGYGALADPASTVSLALASLLTIFVALFGIRLLLGYPMERRDIVTDILKIGIMLTLATSWPAWRILGYDLLVDGPGEIARAIGLSAGLPGSSGDLHQRLQSVDGALAALNVVGSGRIGVAQGDWFQLGFARIAFLAGSLGPLALVRLSGGLLLAIAPLMAGLLLFDVSRPLFAGWLRALVMLFLAASSVTILLECQLALMEPWLRDVILKRENFQQTLDAPSEALAIGLAFMLVLLGLFGLLARVSFFPGSRLRALSITTATADARDRPNLGHQGSITALGGQPLPSHSIAMAISGTMRREERMGMMDRGAIGMGAANAAMTGAAGRGAAPDPAEMLGSSYRRSARRISAAGRNRDGSA